MRIKNKKRAYLKEIAQKEIQEGLSEHFNEFDETEEEVRDFFLKGSLPMYKESYQIIKKFL